ncbi:MAG: PLP-dependent aminotransferase family protein [Chloroflexi bacterium]|uniref:aminotransferase-like domain-containing protein n=1 Tax=Candidatus Flexifilum breve TaxID=3140694 RepID=UPI0031349F08|nr:PLP-dependent aminotransferase family protein [Chloroflexota bacterium]
MVNWERKCAERTHLMARSTIREILKLTQRPDIISFAGGLPAPELFPVERVKEAADRVLTEHGAEALQYGASEGVRDLRDLIAERMSRGGVNVTRDDILIVSGAQQGIDLIGKVLLEDGDGLAVEDPTYMGMLQAWRPYNLCYYTVPTDHDGLDLDVLRRILRENPKLIYLVPNFQNPQGVTLSAERRRALIELLDEFDGIVVEDNPYGELRYSGEHIPSLYELDAEYSGKTTFDGHVIYLGTFSKILAPGVRVGWIAAPPAIMERLVQAKQASDLHTSTLTQMLVAEVARDGFLDEHVECLRDVYEARRDLMLEAMETYFPKEVRWAKPDGGLFLMAYAPEYVDMTDMFKVALEHKVAYVPGADFFVGGTAAGGHTFRLNFSNARPAMIDEGIKRLGAMLHEVVAFQPTH